MTIVNPELASQQLDPELARLHILAASRALIHDVVQNPGMDLGPWSAGVFPDGNGVVFARRSGNDYLRTSRSVILKLSGACLDIYTYRRNPSAVNDVELRSMHSRVTPYEDIHEGRYEFKAGHIMYDDSDVDTGTLEAFNLYDVIAQLDDLADSRDHQPAAAPARKGWLRRSRPAG